MNSFNHMDWNFMLNQYQRKTEFDIQKYYRILCPEQPDFLDEYCHVPSMQRLKGVGLLCGTDWTLLYRNRFYYSRFDHSVGVALIVWKFTHDKVQTLAGLFHDISTPVFSHVADFRKGDALTQTATENETEDFIRKDKTLCALLKRDGIKVEQVSDYHLYPVADNERPQLSADRLEYMFPSGAALQGSWSLEEVAAVYGDITVLQNEKGEPELGFKSVEKAELYCEKFLETGHVLQLNENKLTLQMLAKITAMAVDLGIVNEEDFYSLSEKQIMERFEEWIEREIPKQVRDDRISVRDDRILIRDDGISVRDDGFTEMYRTYRNMTEVLHTDEPMKDCFCVSIKVKQRYINPLVQCEGGKIARLSAVSEKAGALIQDFLRFEDKKFGCVKLMNN